MAGVSENTVSVATASCLLGILSAGFLPGGRRLRYCVSESETQEEEKDVCHEKGETGRVTI